MSGIQAVAQPPTVRATVSSTSREARGRWPARHSGWGQRPAGAGPVAPGDHSPEWTMARSVSSLVSSSAMERWGPEHRRHGGQDAGVGGAAGGGEVADVEVAGDHLGDRVAGISMGWSLAAP